jgi:hypothetical protein
MSDWEARHTQFRITISYAHADQGYAEAVADHLKQLAPGGLASTWFDGDIRAGSDWSEEIEREISGADVIIMLVSHAYLGSDFINQHELGMIESARARGAGVWPVLIGDCCWRSHDRVRDLQFFSGGQLLRAPTTKTFTTQVAGLVAEIASFLQERLMATRPPEKKGTSDTDGAPSDVLTTTSTARLTSPGAAHKGSQLQTQLYVNRNQSALSKAVSLALPITADPDSIHWRSPLESEGFAEFRDDQFLQAIELGGFSAAHKEFWPRPGPVWDGLAVIDNSSLSGGRGVVLAEGKGYPREMNSSCKASPASRARIFDSIAWMQSAAGVVVDPEALMATHYQLANRLAHVYWLRQRVGVDAWLAILMFADDDDHHPTTRDEWMTAMDSLYEEFGLQSLVGDSVLPIILPALRPR